MRKRKYISKKERWVSNGYGGKVKKTYYKYPRRYRPRKNSIVGFLYALMKTSLDKGTQRKTTENELPSLTQCTA